MRGSYGDTDCTENSKTGIGRTERRARGRKKRKKKRERNRARQAPGQKTRRDGAHAPGVEKKYLIL